MNVRKSQMIPGSDSLLKIDLLGNFLVINDVVITQN